jgi:hypothetical protein
VSEQLAPSRILRPNEGISRSERNALLAAGLFDMLGGFASGLISWVAFGLVGHLHHRLIFGIPNKHLLRNKHMVGMAGALTVFSWLFGLAVLFFKMRAIIP